MKNIKAGEGIITLGILIWMSVSVGPWWIGLVLFMGGMILNLLVTLAKAKKEA
jgi:hypothetical protein